MATSRKGNRDWSRVEVEATVAAYLAMLRLEIAGVPYIKAEHRRRLMAVLDGRSEGAIERKHQNISAILIDHLHLPYIEGYKPLRNYQALLREVVEDRVLGDPELLHRVEMDVVAPVAIPSVDNILEILTEAPDRDRPLTYDRVGRPRPPSGRIDYLRREAANQALGQAGEALVLNFERARLIAANRERLADQVEQVSVTRGDHVGFDILSFEHDGASRLIEVKTTKYGPFTPFYLSSNELHRSRESDERYHLYRVFSFRNDPRMFVRSGPIDHGFALDPTQYVARLS